MRTKAFGMWQWQVRPSFRRWPGFLLAAALVPLFSLQLQATPSVVTLGGGGALPLQNGGAGYVNGNTYNLAMFNDPAGMALDPSGTYMFLADYNNNAIRLISNLGNNASSVTTTFAGTNQNEGVNHPLAVLVDSATNVFVLNHGNGTNGAILTFSGLLMGPSYNVTLIGPILASNLVNATAMAEDGDGNFYVTVKSNQVIRVTPNGLVATIGTVAHTNTLLAGIAVLDNGQLALTDSGNHGIWILNPTTGQSTPFAGFNGPHDTNGLAAYAAFNAPKGISKAGNGMLVVADYGNHKVKQIDANGTVSLLYGVSSNLWVTAGTDTPGWWDGLGTPNQGDAEARYPFGVFVARDGSVYTTEDYYHIVRHVTSTGFSAPQPGYPPFFNGPDGLAYDSINNQLYLADTNNTVRVLDLNDNATATYLTADDGVTNPVSVLIDPNENLYVLNQGTGSGYILEFDMFGYSPGPIITGLNQPTAFTLDGYGNLLVTEQAGNVRAFGTSMNPLNLTVASITNANVSLQGIAIFDDGTIAVSDAGNDVIWSINAITKSVSRLTGQLGVSGRGIGTTNSARLNQPHQLARASGNQIVAADSGNDRLVLVQRNGTVTTNLLNSLNATIWFGNANDPVASSSANFVPMVSPLGVAIGDGFVFASETRYADIRGLASTIAPPTTTPGVPIPVYASLGGMALNEENSKLFISDPTSNTVRVLNLLNNSTTVALNAANGLNHPVDVAVDSSDNLYVLNQGTGNNGSILEFDVYGDLVGTNAASLPLPTAMHRDFFGDLYVTELNGLVQEFTGSSSNTIATITNANVRLEGVAVLDSGLVVVSDAGNDVLWKIAANGPVLFTGIVGSPGTSFGTAGFAQLNQPMRLASALNGRLLIADSGNNRVVEADDQGTIFASLNSTNASLWFGLPIDPVGSGSAEFVPMLAPVGLAIGPGTASNGVVYVSENIYEDVRGVVAPGILPPIPPPAPPLNLVASVTYGQVTLTWSASTGATNYYVEHAASSGGPYAIIDVTSGTSYTDFELGGSTNYYVVVAVNLGGVSSASAEVAAVPLTPPPPAPIVGWFDYEGNDVTGRYSVLHPVTVSLYYNDQLLAVNMVTNGVSCYYTDDGSDPRSSTTRKQPPHPYYADGVSSYDPLPSLPNPGMSNLVIKAVNIDSLGQTSAVTTARFIFEVGTPSVIGNNAAQFTISDQTSNTWVYYTLDGSDPTNAATDSSIGPVYLTNYVNGAFTSRFLGVTISTNTTMKIRGYRYDPDYPANPYGTYLPSATAEFVFQVANYVPNIISFGFGSGEASSDFIAAAGQTFVAPVTLTMLPNNPVYSLQFNLVVTNGGPNPGPAINPGAFTFQSMLMKPDLSNPGDFLPIPTYMFAAYEGVDVNSNQLVNYNGKDFVDLEFTNTSINLLGVGWLERVCGNCTNLYDTKSQDLIAYSMAHDDMFTEAGGKIITGGYSFQVPVTASLNQTYQIQIGSPSATSDGVGAPGSSVYIYAPTNGSYTNGAVNAVKNVTIGQVQYLVGSVYPFRWFNAGDFGSSNIVNADVMQVFQTAIYGFNSPPAGSDFFDAMDSCGATYTALPNGLLIQDTTLTTNQTIYLFDGDDTTINQIAFGDGILDVCDVYVTYRRSLDPSLAWFQRSWFKGERVAQIIPNVTASVVSANVAKAAAPTSITGKATAKIGSAPTINPQVNFTATDVLVTNGQTFVQVPITATILGNYPLRVLLLNLEVTPLDGSPNLTTPVSFTQTAAVLGTPTLTSSTDNGNFAAAWLNSTNLGLTGTNTIGYLNITLPANATATAAYAIHFDHASASPNGLGSFPKQTLTGLITFSSRTNSSFNDGIPDTWRLRWFGTINNVLSTSNACPTGDGINNWSKYVAGMDPEVAHDFPSTTTKAAPPGATAAITWPSVSGKHYVIERSLTLFNGTWTAISTNTGTGANMEFDDTNTGKAMFYRVLILP